MFGRKLPKGTIIVSSKRLAMQNAMLEDGFRNLESFQPQRFLVSPGGSDLKMDRGTWRKYNLSFGGGPRECPGKDLFKYEAMLLLRELALRFDGMDFDEATCGVNGENIEGTQDAFLRPNMLNLRFSSCEP